MQVENINRQHFNLGEYFAMNYFTFYLVTIKLLPLSQLLIDIII